mmetsp:Transcript_7013/g.15861  ORF Transcript_7013/g.15861 Transcript_7013/m.15861 type:complete len:218 (-) Transcript_7013:49-702(-)
MASTALKASTSIPIVTYHAADSNISEDTKAVELSLEKMEVIFNSSHSDASDFFQSWDLDANDMDLASEPGMVTDEDDVFMQLEEGESLLPPIVFITNGISNQVVSDTFPSLLKRRGDSAMPLTLLSSDQRIRDINGIHCSPNVISLMHNPQTQFQAVAHTLRESMLKSRCSRRNLCDILHGMNYQRTSNFVALLYSVEFSTHHVNSFCRGATTATVY